MLIAVIIQISNIAPLKPCLCRTFWIKLLQIISVFFDSNHKRYVMLLTHLMIYGNVIFVFYLFNMNRMGSGAFLQVLRNPPMAEPSDI